VSELAYIDFVSKLHKKTNRDYIKRVMEADKAECAIKAKKFGYDYWDGDRKYGYGGYKYDERWNIVARDMIEHYKLKSGNKVLDVGCGKAFLLYEFKDINPEIDITGIDISEYAIKNAKPEVKDKLRVMKAQKLEFADNAFDFVYSITTLHNLYINDLKSAILEIERVSKGNSYILVEAYRNEREKVNLLYWQLTCECFYTPEEWEWIFKEWGYTGDYSFIYFE
jgi:SAM-dependent methyltransferase